MIKFQDFVPKVKTEAGFFTLPTVEQLTEPLRRANDWIANNDIEVINIETVTLPNIFIAGEEGSTDTQIRTSGEMGSYWHQFIRIWYQTL